MNAGYSSTPLPKKLGLKPGIRVLAILAPSEFSSLLLPWPEDMVLHATRDSAKYGIVMIFSTLRDDLATQILEHLKTVERTGAIWACWPKRASKVETDITEDVIRYIALPLGLVDNKVCAINETWSGLRLVWRLTNR